MRYTTVRARCGALPKRAAQNPYVRVFALLLLTVVAILVVLMGVWCNGGCSCNENQEEVEAVPDRTWVDARISGSMLPGARFPGDGTYNNIRGHFSGENPGHLTLIYTPPQGIANLSFAGRQPDEQRADGSYVWNNVPVEPGEFGGWTTSAITAQYNVPYLAEGQTQMAVVSTLTVVHPDGQQSTSEYVEQVRPTSGGSDAALPASQPQADAARNPAVRAEDYYLWKVSTWSSIFGVAMTTETCQQWVDLLQQGKIFVGMRYPLLNATPPYTDSYKLPVAFTGQYSPTLELIDYSSGPPTSVLTISMTYKPAYHTFLSNALPWEDDERWFALGADDSQPITCPEGLNLDRGDWEVMARLWLDFGGAEGDCANCTLPVYYCYQGEEWPAFAGAASGLLNLSSTAYEGWGITCIGPHLLRLGNGMTVPKFGIYETTNQTVSPTEQITLHHRVVNHGTETVTLTLGVTSTLGADWSLYTDSGQPLTQPIVLTTKLGYFFRVCGTIPADAHGPHTVYVTATSATPPNPSVQATDLLWVGDWESPPPPTTWYRTRFPVVMIQ